MDPLIRSEEIGRVITMENNIYIYCISHNTLVSDSSMIGFHNEQIYQLKYKDLSAYVSKILFTHVEVNFENLQCHENVITHIMKECDVLPMKFSTICKSEQSVIELLQKYYMQFIHNLENIAGKIELGIKVFYKLNFEEEDKVDKELLNDPKQYMRKRYERYCSRQKKVDGTLMTIMVQHRNLMNIASDTCYNTPLKNNLIFNASYLVLNDKKEEFDIEVDKIKKSLPEYKILYSGPWPAYHFVNIKPEGEENE